MQNVTFKNLEESSQEISSVALLSPACRILYLVQAMNYDARPAMEPDMITHMGQADHQNHNNNQGNTRPYQGQLYYSMIVKGYIDEYKY